MRDAHLLSLLREPWLMTEDAFHVVRDVILRHAAGERLTEEEIAAVTRRRPDTRQPGQGVAVVPLRGVITPHAGSLEEMSGATSVEGFMQNLRAAVNDPNVARIILDVDSNGGQVALVPEAAAEIRQLRRQKPITAVANTYANSAAYYLASQATEMVVSPSGKVGSIGVLVEHVDMSEALAAEGVKPTLVYAGEFKVEGNPYGPLTDDARAEMQASVDAYYRMFVADVAKGRGVTEATVRNDFGKGRVLRAPDALAAGMVDRVASLNDEIQRAVGASPTRRLRAQDAADDETAQEAAPDATEEAPEAPEEAEADAVSPSPAVRPHRTPVVDARWKVTENVNRLRKPVTDAHAAGMYAHRDETGWRFPHHLVDEKGRPGPANVRAVRAILASLDNCKLAAADRTAVERHLRRHLADFGR